MILKELERIVGEARRAEMLDAYIRNALKEYLQVYVLYFVYTTKKYSKNLIFTGGTCLRHFFDLARLSEDIDFDYETPLHVHQLQGDLESFFAQKYLYKEMTTSLKQRGQQILLKFPVLRQLGISRRGESELLHVKLDINKNPSAAYSLEMTSKSLYGMNYVARHYSLPDLMAGKIHAILTRRHFKGRDNRERIKARDYFDLLWFVKKGVRPNGQRLSEMLGRPITFADVQEQLNAKVQLLVTKHRGDFASDLQPLISQQDFVREYVENYEMEYARFKNQSFSTERRNPV